MLPTLKPGQDVLVWSWFYSPKVEDIVIVKSVKGKVKREIVKRIIKIEGKQVYIEGDNKKESTDSKDFGPVKRSQIIGKVIWYQR